MVQQGANGEGQALVLQKLSPIFELTPLIRPRLLLAASTFAHGPLVMGMLYHRDKDAFQSRLRFWTVDRPTYLRRTRWRHFPTTAQINHTIYNMEQQFRALAASMGGKAMLKTEFPLQASEEIVLQTLFASGIPALLS